MAGPLAPLSKGLGGGACAEGFGTSAVEAGQTIFGDLSDTAET